MGIEKTSDYLLINVEEERQKQIETLKKAIDEAYKNRVAVSLKNAFRDSNMTEEVGFADDRNGVWVEDPHMYPILLKLAYEKTGFRGKKLRTIIDNSVKHETEHLVPIIGSKKIKSRLGIRFFKVTLFPFLVLCQAEIDYQGEITSEEEIDLLTNVATLSKGDKDGLNQLEKSIAQ